MYKLPKEQRDLLISQMPLSELQTNLISYVDQDALSHEGHRKRMQKYTLKNEREMKKLKLNSNVIGRPCSLFGRRGVSRIH